jgi:hypothetical protein
MKLKRINLKNKSNPFYGQPNDLYPLGFKCCKKSAVFQKKLFQEFSSIEAPSTSFLFNGIRENYFDLPPIKQIKTL